MFRTVGAGLLAIGLALGGAARAEDGVKIGMITTLSGGGSHLGIDVRDGFLLAIEMSGRSDIEVIVEDDAQKPDLAKQIADRMVQLDKIDIMTGIIWSNIALAIVPPTTAQGVFYLSPNAGPSQLAGAGCSPLYFNVSWQNDMLPEGMGAYMQANGFTNPVLLAPNYPAGKDMVAGFRRFYTGEIAGEIFTELGQTDYAAEIAQIRASGADSVFFFLPGGMGIAFMKQYGAAEVGIPVYGPTFSFDEIILGAIGDAAIGARHSSHWANDLDNAANVEFTAAFRAKYGRVPTLYAAQGYDTARLILSALETASPDDKDAFQAALEAANFESVRGPFRFGPNHHPIHNIYVLEVVAGASGPENKLIGVAIENHQDAYAGDCAMQ